MPVSAFHRGPPKSLSSAACGPVSRIVVSVIPLYCFACCTAVAAIGSATAAAEAASASPADMRRGPASAPAAARRPDFFRSSRRSNASSEPCSPNDTMSSSGMSHHLSFGTLYDRSGRSFRLEGSLSSSGIDSDSEPRLRVEEAQRRRRDGHVDHGLRRCLGTDREPPDERSPACGPEPVEVSQS